VRLINLFYGTLFPVELKEYSLESVSSTNLWCKEHLKEFSKEALTVVSATEQIAGKGQRGKSWHSPADVNLYLSYCFFVPEADVEALTVTHVLALVVAQKINENGLRAIFKWPNDLKIEEKKVSGILCETVSESDGMFYIVGLGLNLNMSKEECEKVSQPATSLIVETGKAQVVWEWKQKISMKFKECIEAFLKNRSLPEKELRALMSPCQEPRES
jgi:BirA family transcriptional regulator, biotin operon repressor / biotin---[acetyl-CoA-carboxylase] ligase